MTTTTTTPATLPPTVRCPACYGERTVPDRDSGAGTSAPWVDCRLCTGPDGAPMGYVQPVAGVAQPSDVKIRPNRADGIAMIKRALRVRSGKAWSVSGGRGTGYGWITISSPPARRVDSKGVHQDSGDSNYYMTAADQRELGVLLGLRTTASWQGVSVSPDERPYYVARAEGTLGLHTPEAA